MIVGCGGEEGESPCLNYSATGNFTYTYETTLLAMHVEESTFPNDVGLEGEYTATISETDMVWKDSENNELIWSRESGMSNDINGSWTRIVEGINYSLTMNADNTFTLKGENCY